MNSLSPTAQKVQDALITLGCKSTVIEFSESTHTAQEAAQRAGCELGQIVKSLIFREKKSLKPLLVLTSGVNRVNEEQLARHAGEPIERPDAEFVKVATGYAIGGVPPIGHPHSIETFLDEDLMQYPVLWAAAGTPNAIFEIPSAELLRITGAKVIRVS